MGTLLFSIIFLIAFATAGAAPCSKVPPSQSSATDKSFADWGFSIDMPAAAARIEPADNANAKGKYFAWDKSTTISVLATVYKDPPFDGAGGRDNFLANLKESHLTDRTIKLLDETPITMGKFTGARLQLTDGRFNTYIIVLMHSNRSYVVEGLASIRMEGDDANVRRILESFRITGN